MLDSQSMASLAAKFCGELISPEDSGFDEARALYNGMIDKRLGLIPRCADVADVITAVKLGRDKNLVVAIRTGGHSGPGLGSCNDGLVGTRASVSLTEESALGY